MKGETNAVRLKGPGFLVVATDRQSIQALSIKVMVKARDHARSTHLNSQRQKVGTMLCGVGENLLAYPRHNEVDRMDFLALKLQ
jgi:hypothetical protein